MGGGYQAYPEYRDSGVEWLGEVPVEWKVSKTKFFSILNPSKSIFNNTPQDIEVTFLPMEAIGEQGTIDLSRIKVLKDVIHGYTYIGENDVCIAKITPCFENGKGAVIRGAKNGIAFATTEIIPLRCYQRKDSKFLYYMLTSKPFNKEAEGSMYGAGGQKRVSDSFVANYHFALPSFNERQKIARFLDHETQKIDTLIEKQQQLIKLLKEKRQAVISHAVTKGLDPDVPMKDSGVEWLGDVPEHWKINRFKFLVNERAAGPYGSSLTKAMYTPTGIKVYGQQQVISNDFSIGDYYISESKFKEMKRYEVFPEDLLVSVMGTVGKVAVVPKDIHRGIINPRLVKYKIKKKYLLPEFVQASMLSEVSQALLSYTSQGTTMDGLNMQILGEMPIAYPTIEEQGDILFEIQKHAEKFDCLIDKVKHAINLLQERRTALISAAVTGKIDVRNWQPPKQSNQSDQATATKENPS